MSREKDCFVPRNDAVGKKVGVDGQEVLRQAQHDQAKTKSMSVLMTIVWSLLIALVITIILNLSARAQRTQLGNGALNLSKPFTVSNPLYYVDTTTQSYWQRSSAKGEWGYVRKLNGRVVDTVYYTKVVHDTVIVTIGSSTDTILKYVNGYFLSPEKYGACHGNYTFAQKNISQANIDRAFAGIGATVNDNIDWAAWQMAINDALANGIGGVQASGTNYYINKPLNIGTGSKPFEMDGNECTITTSNTLAYSMIYRPAPADQAGAMIQVSTKIKITDFNLHGAASQTGIELNCTYGSIVTGNWMWNTGTGIHLSFCMGGLVSYNFWQFTRYGVISDYGTWKGSSTVDSPGNCMSFQGNHHACNDAQGITYDLVGASDNHVFDFITEQNLCKTLVRYRGLTFGGNYNLVIENGHPELNSGLTGYAFDIVWPQGGGICRIVNVNYPMGSGGNKWVSATCSSGLGRIEIQSTFIWSRPADGKLFYNSGCNWYFIDNQALLANQDVASLFTGVIPTKCVDRGACGYNQFSIY